MREVYSMSTKLSTQFTRKHAQGEGHPLQIQCFQWDKPPGSPFSITGKMPVFHPRRNDGEPFT